jgi:hypothetical protein
MHVVPTTRVRRIVSGGQTGVDRGALDAAIELGIEHGGWCPRGRLAEDGIIPIRYRLIENDSTEYWVRTEQNVVDSDGTLILYRHNLRGGTELTYRMTRKHGKPSLLLDLRDAPLPLEARRWIDRSAIEVLNCAGPRESLAPGIADEARQLLTQVLAGDVA